MRLVDIWNWIKKGPQVQRPIKQTLTPRSRKKMKKETLIVKTIEVMLVLMMLAGVIMFVFGGHWWTPVSWWKKIPVGWWWIPAIAFLLIPIGFFVGGLRGVRKTDRWVIEVFGEFYVVRQPGLQWVCPLLMNVQAIVDIREIKLPLFEEEIKIDFRNGSAKPKGATAFLKIQGKKREEVDESVKRAIYNIDGWRPAATALIENGLRSFLNSMTIEEGLERGKGGYNLLISMSESKSKKHKDAADGIITALESWGFELTRVLVEDFDLDPAVIQAREALFRKQRDREMAVLERGIRAEQTMGANVDMATIAMGKDPQKKKERYQYPEDKATELAHDYTTRQISADAGALVDVHGEGLGGEIAALLGGAAKSIKSGTSKPKNP